MSCRRTPTDYFLRVRFKSVHWFMRCFANASAAQTRTGPFSSPAASSNKSKWKSVSLLVCRRETPQWRWTRTVIQMRRVLRRVGTGRTDRLPATLVRTPLCELSLHLALPLALRPALAPAAALAPLRAVPLPRRRAGGPTPCPHPAPGPFHTMTGLMTLLSARWSTSTQECSETKVFTLLGAG